MSIAGPDLAPELRDRVQATLLDALHEKGVAARTVFPGAVSSRGVDPRDTFKASQAARRAHGAPLWADVVEWAEANARKEPRRVRRYVAYGILPEGWQP